MTLGDRVVIMCDGVIQQVGPPLELYAEPVNRFVAGFLGTPPMNFLTGRLSQSGSGGIEFLEQNGSNTNGQGTALKLTLPPHLHEAAGSRLDREIVLGLRPEGIFAATGESSSAETPAAQPLRRRAAKAPRGAAFRRGPAGGLTDRRPSLRPDGAARPHPRWHQFGRSPTPRRPGSSGVAAACRRPFPSGKLGKGFQQPGFNVSKILGLLVIESC